MLLFSSDQPVRGEDGKPEDQSTHNSQRSFSLQSRPDLTEEEIQMLNRKMGPGQKYTQKQMFREEIESPFRKTRLFLVPALAASAALGAFIRFLFCYQYPTIIMHMNSFLCASLNTLSLYPPHSHSFAAMQRDSSYCCVDGSHRI